MPDNSTSKVSHQLAGRVSGIDGDRIAASIRRLSLGFAILAGCGALTATAFTIMSGVQYRMQEDQGLQPGYAPDWIVLGTYAGLWLFALSVVALAVTGVVQLWLRRRSAPKPTDVEGNVDYLPFG